MFTKLRNVFVILALVSMIGWFNAQPSQAAAPSADGPNSAVAPSDDWVGLAPDQKRWYIFHYDYNQNVHAPSEALVELEMSTKGSVRFEVWTPAQVQLWANDVQFEPIGTGAVKSDFTLNKAHDTKLIWATSTPASETFYVIVENRRPVASYFKLSITGTDVSFPTAASFPADLAPTSMEMSAGEEVLTESLAIEVDDAAGGSSVMRAGTGPDLAFVPSGAWLSIEPGQQIWYSFRYDYRQHVSTPSTAIVQLEMGTEDSVSFEVWTSEQVRKWAREVNFEPIGMGSRKSDLTGNRDHDTKLLWTTGNKTSETFYIIVENERDITSYFALDIAGEDVSYPSMATSDTQMLALDSHADDKILTEALGIEVMGILPTSSAGYGPETAAMPSPGAKTLAPGQMHWYAFRSQVGLHSKNAHSANAHHAEIMVLLKEISGGTATFEVWSDEDVRAWRAQTTFTPTGAGTANDHAPGKPDAYWAGNFEHNATFYVVVMNNTPEAGSYTLDIRTNRKGDLTFPSHLTILQ